jgi:2-keto-3-deoxy-L-arabinonate dehydratase
MIKPTGVHCVLFALFDADGALDRAAMAAQVTYVRHIGADGIVVLGLATEVGKLTYEERCQIIQWSRQDAADLPLGVTISGNSIAEQKALISVAEAAGADWLILQPPLAGTYQASEYVDFFAAVGQSTTLPIAIQNAPQYLGRSLSNDDIALLKSHCPNFKIIKSETGPMDLAALVSRQKEALIVMNGRGGLEMTDCLRAGCQGFIVAPDVLPGVLSCWKAWQSGDEAKAEAAYAAFLPAAIFGMQSLETLACYGKRIFGLRAGIPIQDRAPALRPDAFGLAMAARWAGK